LIDFGIGRGHAHFTIVSSQSEPTHSDYQRYSTVGHGLPGMDDDQVLNLGSLVVQGFQKPAPEGRGTQMENLTAAVKKSCEFRRQPMIALKSGCAIMFSIHDGLKCHNVL